MFSTFLLLFIAVVLPDQLHSILQQLGSSLEQLRPIAQVIVPVVAAFIGAVVSVLARLRYFLDAARDGPLLVYVTVTTKPLVAIAFATFIYAIMGSGLVTVPVLSLRGPTATTSSG